MKSFNEATGQETISLAKGLIASATRQFAKIAMLGTSLLVTPNHELQDDLGRWMPAGQVQANQCLRLANNQIGQVQSIEIIKQTAPVYSLVLENDNHYFVGNANVLAAGTCNLVAIKNALGVEFSAFQNRILMPA